MSSPNRTEIKTYQGNTPPFSPYKMKDNFRRRRLTNPYVAATEETDRRGWNCGWVELNEQIALRVDWTPNH